MNPSGRRAWYRTLSSLPLIAVMLSIGASIGAASLTGQTFLPLRDGSLANVEPYLYAAEDFGIDPSGGDLPQGHRPDSPRELREVPHGRRVWRRWR